jgi:ion channel-forming bestrophin family protein
MIDYDPKNWIALTLQMRGSALPNLMPRILVAAAIGVIAAYIQDRTGFHLPVVAHTLIGVALSLLLVFRTNTSYDRFWEGRKLLGSIVNRTRDLARQTSALIDGTDASAKDQRKQIGRLISMLYGLMRQDLRSERTLADLGMALGAEERAALEPSEARPALVATWISQRLIGALREGRITEQRLQLMDANLTALIDSWGGAQRIKNTPVPFAYAQHIKIFVMFFGFTVPFAIVDSLHWYTPVAAALLAFALFGIDEIGVEIEEPFGKDLNDLPMEKIGETIAKNVAEMIEAAEHMPPQHMSLRPGPGAPVED